MKTSEFLGQYFQVFSYQMHCLWYFYIASLKRKWVVENRLDGTTVCGLYPSDLSIENMIIKTYEHRMYLKFEVK
jgi:hypothetical protein